MSKTRADSLFSILSNVLVANNAIDWLTLSMQLPLSGLGRMLVKHCELANWDLANKVMTLTLEESQNTLLSVQRQTQIQDALKSHLGMEIKLIIKLGAVKGVGFDIRINRNGWRYCSRKIKKVVL